MCIINSAWAVEFLSSKVFSKFFLEQNTGQREQGSGGSSPVVRGSGGSCNLVQEISFCIVKFS